MENQVRFVKAKSAHTGERGRVQRNETTEAVLVKTECLMTGKYCSN